MLFYVINIEYIGTVLLVFYVLSLYLLHWQ